MPGYYKIEAEGLWANLFKFLLYIIVFTIFILSVIWILSPDTFTGIKDGIFAWFGGIGAWIGGGIGDVWNELIGFLGNILNGISNFITDIYIYVIQNLGDLLPSIPGWDWPW